MANQGKRRKGSSGSGDRNILKLPKACKIVDDNIFCKVGTKNIKMKACRWYLGNGSSCEDFEGNSHGFKDTIFPINLDKSNRVESKGTATIQHGFDRIDAYTKELYHSGFIGDLGNDGDILVIRSYYGGLPVRRIKIGKKEVSINAMDGEKPLKLAKNIEILYEPWFMDRGSFIFTNPSGNPYPAGQMLKIATEMDILEKAE